MSPSCPRCGGVLWGRALPAGVGHACGTCGGVWLDPAASRRMTEVFCTETLAHAEAGARVARYVPDTRAALGCPVCGSPLARNRVGHAAVEIDTCTAHGTWFDKDELERVAQAYAASRAYGRHGSAALAGGAAMAGAAAVAQVASGPAAQRAVQGVSAEDVADLAIEAGVEALAAVDAGDVAEGALDVLCGLLDALG